MPIYKRSYRFYKCGYIQPVYESINLPTKSQKRNYSIKVIMIEYDKVLNK